MIRAAALAALLSATSAAAQDPAPAAHPPEQAAGQALQACVAHTFGYLAITPANAEKLAALGLVHQADPPSPLNRMVDTAYGHGTVTALTATEGSVWAVGYDSGVCIVMTLGTAAGPVEARLRELFAIPDGFKPEPIEQKPGATWSAWRWSKPKGDVIAQMSLRDVPSTPGKGMVMVTFAPRPHGAK